MRVILWVSRSIYLLQFSRHFNLNLGMSVDALIAIPKELLQAAGARFLQQRTHTKCLVQLSAASCGWMWLGHDDVLR